MADHTNPLSKPIRAIAARMLADLEESSDIEHRGSKGTVREVSVLHQFLDLYLPKSVQALHNGEILDTAGTVSPQCDLMVVDKMTPRFHSREEYHVVPAECVYGTIEVKSNLTSGDTGELSRSLKSVTAFKTMRKSAFGQPLDPRECTVYGKKWNYQPIASMVFAHDGANLDTLAEIVANHAQTSAVEHTIDSVWVLKKGYIGWHEPDDKMTRPTRTPSARLIAVEATQEQVLLSLTMHLQQLFGAAWMPPLRLLDYIPDGTELGKTIGGYSMD
jgi:hypothetical protein